MKRLAFVFATSLTIAVSAAGCSASLQKHAVPSTGLSLSVPENWTVRYGKDCTNSALMCTSQTGNQGSTQCLLERAEAGVTAADWLAKNKKDGGVNRSGTMKGTGGDVAFVHIFDKPHEFKYFHRKSEDAAYTLHCVEVGTCSWGSLACDYADFDSLGKQLAN